MPDMPELPELPDVCTAVTKINEQPPVYTGTPHTGTPLPVVAPLPSAGSGSTWEY